MCFLRTIRVASRIATSTSTRIEMVLRGKLSRRSGGLHRIEDDLAVLGLGDDLVLDDQDVAIVQTQPAEGQSIDHQIGHRVARKHIADAEHRNGAKFTRVNRRRNRRALLHTAASQASTSLCP